MNVGSSSVVKMGFLIKSDFLMKSLIGGSLINVAGGEIKLIVST